MKTRAFLPLFITASLAVLLLVGFLTKAEPITAVNPVPCPTLVPVATATPDGGPTYTATVTFTPCLIKLTSTPTPTPTITPTPLPMGGAMSLRIDASQQALCSGGPVAGEVCVFLGQKFDVIVVADEIPAAGYILAQVWIDYDNQGLVHKKNTQTQWPDCGLPTFLVGQDEANNGAYAGCLTGLIERPPSFHIGDLYSFSLTCTTGASSSQLELIPVNVAPAGTIGALYVEFGTKQQLVPALSGLTVNCVPAGGHKLPHPGDTDGDGCSDWQENLSDETMGGQRNWKNRWDFYDVAGSPGPPQNGAPDGIVDLPNDILGVIQHHPSGDLGYDAQFDRGPWTGPNSWNETQGPDGVIDLPNDILGVILQFNHNCQ